MEAWVYWVIIAAAAFILELATVGLVSVWFGLAATVTAIFTAVFDGVFTSDGWFMAVQIVLFLVLSVLFLFLTKPLAKKLINPKEINAASIIGKKAVVDSDIDNLEGTGSIRIEGKIWTARCVNGEKIKKGEIVTIESIEGVKAMVKATVAEKVN